ncbi:uncharacterized protein LOC124302545 isoform X1 [Neodiprion virginianus]|uniref:uncharacterized protein LOC124302545 isoform X1 n=2 Tax=Neodiprion virginianus TaxID=2961670 RepID=UPI001EE7044F|nr:uncharacterized protein LOC124302545 isoform X1 [Neodiprion virginianus]
MQKLLLVLVVLISRVSGSSKMDDHALNLTSVSAKTLPAVENAMKVNEGRLKIDNEIRKKCEPQPDYRAYIECLLQETKRKKRQCGPTLCGGYQTCYGSSCMPTNQQQQSNCPGTGCAQNGQPTCSGFGCVFFGHKCQGNGCIQIGETCYGIGCAPPQIVQIGTPSQVKEGAENDGNQPATNNRPVGQNHELLNDSAEVPNVQPENADVTALRKEIAEIRDQLRSVKEQNDRLIEITEKATTLILSGNEERERDRDREFDEPMLAHNLTTSIDISNYVNNTNVINVPSQLSKNGDNYHRERSEPDKTVPGFNSNPSQLQGTTGNSATETKSHCCVVVRPKTCRTIWQPPYVVCGQKKHRTCGSHCYGKQVVHSQVRPECVRNATENCVSYHPAPYVPTYPVYPATGFYPPTPTYYPVVGAAQYYPVYAPAPMPIYAPVSGPIYEQPTSMLYPSQTGSWNLGEDSDYADECEDCETPEGQVITEECPDGTAECNPVVKKGQEDDRNNFEDSLSVSQPGRGDTTFGNSVEKRKPEDLKTLPEESGFDPLAQLHQVGKEAQAIKRSEDQLTTSLGMLEEAVELKRLEEKDKAARNADGGKSEPKSESQAREETQPPFATINSN